MISCQLQIMSFYCSFHPYTATVAVSVPFILLKVSKPLSHVSLFSRLHPYSACFSLSIISSSTGHPPRHATSITRGAASDSLLGPAPPPPPHLSVAASPLPVVILPSYSLFFLFPLPLCSSLLETLSPSPF